MGEVNNDTSIPKTVLIVEDELEIQRLLAFVFDMEGYNVLIASNGREGLGIVESLGRKIDLLVTDLGLPELGGIELIEKARKHIPSLKVIAASGFGHAKVRSELKRVGVTMFFPKPFQPKDLLEAARKLLGG